MTETTRASRRESARLSQRRKGEGLDSVPRYWLAGAFGEVPFCISARPLLRRLPDRLDGGRPYPAVAAQDRTPRN